jgi:hypothetical protein
MTTSQLLQKLEPGMTLLVRNDPFEYQGRAEITLAGGDVVHWLFSDDGSFVSVNAGTDEMVDFWVADEEVERDEEEPDAVGYQGESYELSYGDKGTVTAIVGEVPVEEGETYLFKDFENDDGELVRILENEASGDEQAYSGGVLVEEFVAVVEE